LREITLRPDEFAFFSVPHSFCLAGERQHLLGLGSIVVAGDLRLGVSVEETADPFELALADEGVCVPRETLASWEEALGATAVRGAGELEGLKVSLRIGRLADVCPAEGVLRIPAVAVALACAVQANRGDVESVPVEKLVETAGAMLEQVTEAAGRSVYPQQYHALCCASVLGGAAYVVPDEEPLNVQLLVPPESLILVLDPDAEPERDAPQWREHLLSALRKIGPAADLLRDTERDIAPLFELPEGTLDEAETAVLYGLLRVREMIRERIERMGGAMDNDCLAELCDEESAILGDYLGFRSARLAEIRDLAVGSGALGAKLTWAFGDLPALIIIAPGRRDDVCSAVTERIEERCILPFHIEPAGLRNERE